MRLSPTRPACAAALLLAGVWCACLGSPLDVPFYRQKKNGCGAASVAMVMHFWEGRQPGPPVSYPLPEEVYRALYRQEQKGIPLGGMRRYLQESGFRAFTLRGRWEDLEVHLAKGRPLIVALRKGPTKEIHFVVVTGAEDGFVSINDPTRKKPARLKRAEFQERWAFADGWMLLASP